MRRFERQTFQRFYDENSQALFCDFEFVRCSFESSAISMTLDPGLRSTVRNVRLEACEVRGCSLDCAVVEEVTVDGLTTHGLFQTWAAVFRHVTIRGKVGEVMTSHLLASGRASREQQRELEDANERFYAQADWALDIAAAEFQGCTLWGVPARLVRRDPETQVIVTRANALRGDWRQVDLTGTYWRVSLEELLRYALPDVVLVAPKRHKNFKALLRGLQRLREAGVAEAH
jgi:hypothetical protein